MDRIELKARAKVNLSLEVLGKLPDGYHELASVMQTVDIYDKIVLEKKCEPQIEIRCNLDELQNEDNLAFRAAKKFLEHGKIFSGITIELKKNIPSEAGLGGGSTDAAAVLVGMNRLFDEPLDREELHILARSLGADVPFCLSGGTQLARGIGERLEKLPHIPLQLLIVKPPQGISTKKVFEAFAAGDFTDGKRSLGLKKALAANDRELLFENMYNGMYKNAVKYVPQMGEIIHTLERKFFCPAALMSGSGSAVFAVFEDLSAREAAYGYFSERYEQVFKTQTWSESITILS